MAIFHFSLQIASRSTGKSAVAMAAYRSGERLIDERTGELKAYKRQYQPDTFILAPFHSPNWVYNRNRLWNEVEKREKRKDSQLCREINIALPKEFTDELQKQLLCSYCNVQFVSRGMIADVSIHRNNPNNPHAYIMLTMREIQSDGFGQKIREWNDRKLIEEWREYWAKDVNKVFQLHNRVERIDHRSFERQGIKDLLPSIHEGPIVRQMERRGVLTDRGTINRSVHVHNKIEIELQKMKPQNISIKRDLSMLLNLDIIKQ